MNEGNDVANCGTRSGGEKREENGVRGALNLITRFPSPVESRTEPEKEDPLEKAGEEKKKSHGRQSWGTTDRAWDGSKKQGRVTRQLRDQAEKKKKKSS
jgi:hypothetical protein